MRVIIFDIDGVLNRNEWEESQAAWIQPDLAAKFINLAAFADLCVCCSARRGMITTSLLESHGIYCRLDKLGEGHWKEKLRLTNEWVAKNLKPGDSFVILDDMVYPHERQVVVNQKIGLTDTNIKQAKIILGMRFNLGVSFL